MGTPQSVLRAVEASPMAEVGLEVAKFHDRVEKWRSAGVFEHQDPQAMFEIRVRKLNKVLEWPNACEAHVAFHNLVQTWKDEEHWEKMVVKEIEENRAEAARSGGDAYSVMLVCLL